MLDAFKVKEFDLEPVIASWTEPPYFLGNPKRDPSVDTWLDQIKQGCLERKVPKEYWHKVGQRFLGDKARARLDELKAVLRHMHGGKYRWDWKKFKIAIRNMGWEIDDKETEWVEVQSKPSGLWWIIGRKGKQLESEEWPEGTNAMKKTSMDAQSTKSQSASVSRKPTSARKSTTDRKPTVECRPTADRKQSTDKNDEGQATVKRGWLSRNPSTMSTSSVDSISTEGSSSPGSSFWGFGTMSNPNSVTGSPAQTPGEVTTTNAGAPLWLVNACAAFDFLTTEHPKVMTTLSAVLITVGSLPAMPGISAGAGGALLASHAAQAAGAIAIGLGNWLKASSEAATAKTEQGQAQGARNLKH
ncbi:hypothetical protein FA95DRAFT_1573974 [Auriscalpium vulgare]|uniref:Uncharacterized protein n=1 Tax=Auriscalpium vulgare TaxID=40419 RepID=A0ACB8RM04_9AGAM|nr:hypothetical protein FA95DRAFT_1573974 [Auriscalpium vulgare]